jgi:hypothetical protein
MNETYCQLVRQQYWSSGRDFTELFQTILSIAGQIGLDEAWECLERCVIEKRLAWLDRHLATLGRSGDPLADGYRLFYESYLGVSVGKEGAVVEATAGRLVTRWWNACPTLEACRKLGLDTREVCQKAYHRPVQVFLARVDPRLRFNRNYAVLRPYAPYCEEVITLSEVLTDNRGHSVEIRV